MLSKFVVLRAIPKEMHLPSAACVNVQLQSRPQSACRRRRVTETARRLTTFYFFTSRCRPHFNMSCVFLSFSWYLSTCSSGQWLAKKDLLAWGVWCRTSTTWHPSTRSWPCDGESEISADQMCWRCSYEYCEWVVTGDLSAWLQAQYLPYVLKYGTYSQQTDVAFSRGTCIVNSQISDAICENMPSGIRQLFDDNTIDI